MAESKKKKPAEPATPTSEQQLRDWVEAGITHAEIGRRLGFARSTIAAACTVLGITSFRGRRGAQEQEDVGGSAVLQSVWGRGGHS